MAGNSIVVVPNDLESVASLRRLLLTMVINIDKALYLNIDQVTIEPLATGASLADTVSKVNEVIVALQSKEIIS